MQVKDAIQYIKERLDIADIVREYAELKQHGARLMAPCPFHQETKPSFTVSSEKGFFYCFGCQASGDIFEFYSKINGLDFKECLEDLASRAGITVEYSDNAANASSVADTKNLPDRKKILQMYETASKYYISALSSRDGKICRDYITKRDISPDIAEKFELGFAPFSWHALSEILRKKGYDLEMAAQAGLLGKSETGGFYDRFRGRLIFPIKNLAGQIIAFGGRIIEDSDEPKYINSSETPVYRKKEHLYGLFQARKSISLEKKLILTEGYMDVLALHQFGFNNCAGVLGTALTEEQIKRISGFTSAVFLFFDGDAPGQKAALRACEMFLGKGLACKVVILPQKDDIDSLLRGQGQEVVRNMMLTAQDGMDFCIDAIRKFAPKDMVNWCHNFLEQIRIPELTASFVSLLANHLHIAEDVLRCSAKLPQISLSSSGGLVHKFGNIRDNQILAFAARYPDRLEDLRNIGADIAIITEEGKLFWKLLEQWDAEEAVYHMNEMQKNFWYAQRGPYAPPLSDGDFELECLKKDLKAYYARSQKISLSLALADNASLDDFDADLTYLRAIQETLEKNI